MTSITRTLVTFGLTAGLSCAASWNAKLLDANCSGIGTSTTVAKKASEKLAQSCAPSVSTNAFAILVDGKIYKFDSVSNEKAIIAMKSGSLKADKDGDLHATVSGDLHGDVVTVDSITGKGEHK